VTFVGWDKVQSSGITPEGSYSIPNAMGKLCSATRLRRQL